jgi:hypothetical protein
LTFPGAVTVGYLDGYFVFNEPDSQRIWVTELLDGTSIDPLEFASAEGSPDNVVSILIDHKEVWVFGTNSIEVWYNSGALDYPLSPIQGAFNEVGCVAPYSVAKLDNGIFWLGADARGQGIVYRANGYQAIRISTHAVEWHIQRYGNLSDALAYTYQQDGHAFYVLIFPEANTTWVFDVATGLWHERAGWVNGSFTRHRSNCQMSFNNEIVVGDFQNGNIYALDLDFYKDHDAVQRWLRTWRALPTSANNLKRTAQHTLQLDAESGGVDPTELINVRVVDTTTGEDFLLQEDGDDILLEILAHLTFYCKKTGLSCFKKTATLSLLLKQPWLMARSCFRQASLLPISSTRRLCCVGQTMAVTLGATSIGVRWVKPVSGATASFGVALA